MKEYRARIVDDILEFKLKSKGAVLIEGAKWCGKTTTASQVANSMLLIQENLTQNREMAELSPARLLQGETPRLIDEWQLAPQLWDAVRVEVDKRDAFGQFMLTGSAVPPSNEKITHTGTGRITRMKMRPMTLYESGESTGSVSLKALFAGMDDVEGETNVNLEQIAFLICRGGWPKAIGQASDVALIQAFDYFDAVVSSDISRVDNVERDEERTRNLLRSYSRFIGSQAKIPTIVDDVKANDVENLSDGTIRSYINALKKLFVLEDSPAWNPNLRSKTAIRTSETRYYTDPSIGVAAMGAGPNDLMNDLETMGLFFENMCIRDLRVYAEKVDGKVYHYRDRSGLECDAVVHLRNGQYGLIEIKLGGEKLIAEGIATLTKLTEQIDVQKMKSPTFRMILTATGTYAYRTKDGIFIVPLTCLKD